MPKSELVKEISSQNSPAAALYVLVYFSSTFGLLYLYHLIAALSGNSSGLSIQIALFADIPASDKL